MIETWKNYSPNETTVPSTYLRTAATSKADRDSLTSENLTHAFWTKTLAPSRDKNQYNHAKNQQKEGFSFVKKMMQKIKALNLNRIKKKKLGHFYKILTGYSDFWISHCFFFLFHGRSFKTMSELNFSSSIPVKIAPKSWHKLIQKILKGTLERRPPSRHKLCSSFNKRWQ